MVILPSVSVMVNAAAVYCQSQYHAHGLAKPYGPPIPQMGNALEFHANKNWRYDQSQIIQIYPYFIDLNTALCSRVQMVTK